MVRLLQGESLLTPPRTSMIGALIHYITHCETSNFQPMKANMGLLPEMGKKIRNKQKRYAAYTERARTTFERYLEEQSFRPLNLDFEVVTQEL